jgi:TolB-like protein
VADRNGQPRPTRLTPSDPERSDGPPLPAARLVKWEVRIKACALFIPVISRHTHQRREGYFRLEWKLAVDRSNLISATQAFLLPVVIDDTREDDEEVPEKIREIHWTRLPEGETSPAFVERVQCLLSPDASTTIRGPANARSDALGTVRADRREMLVVLPFENLTTGDKYDYFSDGLTEEMITELARLSPERLGVIARTSAMQFKSTTKNIGQIGGELGVSHVLEGSVRRAGGRLRITAQLIRELDKGGHRYVSPYNVARAYGAIDDKPQALEWLERAYQEHNPDLIELSREPSFASLRSDAKFRELMSRIGWA